MAVPTQPPALVSQRSQEIAQQQQQQQVLQQQQQQLQQQQQQQSAELAVAQKRIEELQRQVDSAREAAKASVKDAEELRGQLAEKCVELEEVKTQVRARDGWLEKEEERRLDVETRLREAQARGAMAEGDLKAAAAELENRDHVIADLRSKTAQPVLSGELGRVMGTSGKTADMIAYLGKELEHEKEANEAHQQRVRFLATQLAETERRGKSELELRDAHCEALRETVARLRLRAAGDAATGTLAKQVEELKREYFQALGVGMKLNLAMQGQNVNVDLASLYDEVRDTLPYADWNRFLSLKLSLQTEASAARRQSLMAELAQLHRPRK
jgi:DNA repair exonuclease SbcCD ATPase subunit